jgi:hypothetical protein
MWYHHYLQHPVCTHLEEKMSTVMYCKGMCTTIWSITRSCKAGKTSKRWKLKYRHLQPKTVISTPRECFCANLIGLHTLKGRNKLQIDCMALAMIYPASSWFKMVELPLVTWLQRQTVNGKELLTANKIFDKTSNCIARLVEKTWLISTMLLFNIQQRKLVPSSHWTDAMHS